MKHKLAALQPLIALLVTGCGSSDHPTPPSENDASEDTLVIDTNVGNDIGADLGDGPTDSEIGPEVSVGEAGDADAAENPFWAPAIYANTGKSLFRFDPTAATINEIGPFVTGTGSIVTDMNDIAVDAGGAMYGVSFGHLYRIVPKGMTLRCDPVATLATNFSGLTYVPAGAIDVKSEVLIGVTVGGAWFRIDVNPGASAAKLTSLGFFGGWSSSGDALGVAGAAYATAYKEVGTDHVVLVDPKTGKVSKDLGDTGQKQLQGLGYWAGVIYAFSGSGSIYKIDPVTAKASEIAGISKPASGWFGAAVTTSVATK